MVPELPSLRRCRFSLCGLRHGQGPSAEEVRGAATGAIVDRPAGAVVGTGAGAGVGEVLRGITTITARRGPECSSTAAACGRSMQPAPKTGDNTARANHSHDQCHPQRGYAR
jgi:hypothetical protein